MDHAVLLVLGVMAVIIAGCYFVWPPDWIEDYWR